MNNSANQTHQTAFALHLIPIFCRLRIFWENGIDSGEKFGIIYINKKKRREK